MKKILSLALVLLLYYSSYSQSEISMVSLGTTEKQTYSIEYLYYVEDINLVVGCEIGERDYPFFFKGDYDEEAKWSEYPDDVQDSGYYYLGVELSAGRRFKNFLFLGGLGYYSRRKYKEWYDPTEEFGDDGYYFSTFNASRNKLALSVKIKYLFALNRKNNLFLMLGTKVSSFDGVGFSLGLAFGS